MKCNNSVPFRFIHNISLHLFPPQSRVVAGGGRHPRAKQLRVAKVSPLKHQQHGVTPKDTRRTEEKSSGGLAQPSTSKGKPAQGQAASFVRMQAPQRIGIVGTIGTTAPVSFSKRRSATTLVDRPPHPPSPAAIKPKRHPVEKRRKISAASSNFSEAASTKTEGISHTTLQDKYVSHVDEELGGSGALAPSSPSLGQRGRHESGHTACTAVDVLSAVSSVTLSKASLDSASVGAPMARSTSTPLRGASMSQSSIGCTAEPLEHCSATAARVTSSTSLTSPASSSKLAGLSASSSDLVSRSSAVHSRVSSASHSIQGGKQLQSNSLKLEVGLSHLQKIFQEQDKSRPSSVASVGPPGAELEGSGNGSRLLLKSSRAGADMPYVSEHGVEEDQASRRDTDILEETLKRRQERKSVTSPSSASTRRSSVSSFSSAVSMKNWEQTQSGHYESEIATVAALDPTYLAAGGEAGVLKQFLMSDVEGNQTLSKAPCSMGERSAGHQLPSDACAPPQYGAGEEGVGSLLDWNYPVVLPRPSSEATSSSASASEVYHVDDAHSPSSTSTTTSLRTGSCSAGVDGSNRASPVSLRSSGTGQLLAALLSPSEPYSTFPSHRPSLALSSDLAQMSSAHSGSTTMPSSIGELESCPSSPHTAPQTQELMSALTRASPVLSDGSGRPSYQEVGVSPQQVPALYAQASSCNLMASSAASCGSSLGSGGLQGREYTAARGHRKEGSVESNLSLEAASLFQDTELPTQGIGVEEQEGFAIGGVPDGDLTSTCSLHDAVEAEPHALSIQPGSSDGGSLEATQLAGQSSMESLKESKASTESTLVGLEGTSPPGETSSLGRRTDQFVRSTPLPPRTLQPETDCGVSESLSSEAQGQDEGPVCLPQKEGGRGGSLTLDRWQREFDRDEDLSHSTPSRGTPLTELHSVACTDSSVAAGGRAGGDSDFDEESKVHHVELEKEGEEGRRTADKQAEGRSALGSASGGQLNASDILERSKAYSKYSLAVSEATCALQLVTAAYTSLMQFAWM